MILVVLSTPYISSLAILAGFFFFQGVSQGVTDLGWFFFLLKIYFENEI